MAVQSARELGTLTTGARQFVLQLAAVVAIVVDAIGEVERRLVLDRRRDDPQRELLDAGGRCATSFGCR
jgi:hypothetical protein